jgi:hypothetical protein
MAETRYRTGEAEPHEELTAREARQARPGRPVLLILIASLLMALVALAGLMSWQRAELPDQRPITEGSRTPVTPPAR